MMPLAKRVALWLFAVFLATSPAFALTQGQKAALFGGCPLGSTVYANFATGQYCGGTLNSLFSISRASVAEQSPTYTSPVGAAFTTFPANTFRVTSGSGLLIEEPRVNYLLQSGTPGNANEQDHSGLAPIRCGSTAPARRKCRWGPE